MPRPPIPIDPDMVLKLSKIGCTFEEIASIVGCSKDTLERRFKVVVHDGWQHRNASLRRKQYSLAMSNTPVQGQVAMLIWLGKQFLGQRDGQTQAQVDSGNRLDELVQALNAGPKPRGSVNNP
jgi:hypothetical protein